MLPLACGCSNPSGAEAPEAPSIQRQGDRIVIPEGSPLRGRLQVEAVKVQDKITPPLAGKVVRIFVKFGDPVKRGQPLLSLDSPDLVAAQSEYLKAKSALSQAERTLARQQDLASHGIGARREVEQAQTDRDSCTRADGGGAGGRDLGHSIPACGSLNPLKFLG
jgi:cobalt-zinc-cadmium efflux system membrane fusion protein